MINNYSAREQVVEIINRLFYYTDNQLWEKLINEVFASEVLLDMVSLGSEKAEILKPQQICDMWKEGFKDLDAIHHQAGNYIIEIFQHEAEVKAYSIASHFKQNAKNGTLREFVGDYEFHLSKIEENWRIDKFKYNLKYMDGNKDLS